MIETEELVCNHVNKNNFTVGEVYDLFNEDNIEEVFEYTARKGRKDWDESKKFLEKKDEHNKYLGCNTFFIQKKDSEEIIGELSFYEVNMIEDPLSNYEVDDFKGEEVRLGMWLLKYYQGEGYCRSLLEETKENIKDSYDCIRIEVNIENERGKKVFEDFVYSNGGYMVDVLEDYKLTEDYVEDSRVYRIPL